MKLCVIETGLPPRPLQDRFAMYGDMTAQWLGRSLPEARFAVASVIRDEALPAVEAFDGYLITGSRHGVYDDLPWMRDLRAFLLRAREARKPVFGICFGHQIMAAAYGGEVRKSGRGWAVGVREYRYAPAAGLANGGALCFHQDQVESVPEGGHVVGGDAHCPIGALIYDFPAMSVQYHPEFTKDYIQALTALSAGGILPVDLAEAAIGSLSAPVDNDRVGARVAAFFRECAPGSGEAGKDRGVAGGS